jgi:hypothetical protein
MSGPNAGFSLSDGWDLSGLTLTELWLRYLAVGGTASPGWVAAYARGLLSRRSHNGKTTLAERIRAMAPGAVVIHTDDIAWEHSRFGWDDLLIDGILRPVRQGQPVSYRPPRWEEHGREGALEVPAGCPLLIVEGDGAGRREVAHLIDTVIWVQADEREAGRRSAARAADRPAADLANQGLDGAGFDEDGWMAEEIPFNAAQRTWERADLIVCGTPELRYDPGTQIVIARPS